MYNNYLGNNQYGGQFYPSYMNYGNYGNVQMPQRQMPQQAPNNTMPFTEILFGTLKEAEVHIVAPSKSVCFINNAMGEIYIKSADEMGNTAFKTYKQVPLTNNSTEPQTSVIDPKEFVKTSDLKDFITKEDLGNFLTRDDLKPIDTKLQELQRRIKINDIMAEGDKNGK